MRAKTASIGKTPIGCLVLFGGVFIAAGLGIFIGLLVLPIFHWMNAQQWEETSCRIVHSEVKSHQGDDSTTYSVDIRYEYLFGDSLYTGDRYNFMGGSSSGYDGKQAIVNRYPPNAIKVCYVNPDNPGEAALSTEFSLSYLIGLFGAPFFAAGAAVIWGGLRSRRRAQLQATALSAGATLTGAKTALPKTPYMGTGQTALRSRKSKVGSLLFGAIFLSVPAVIFSFAIRSNDSVFQLIGGGISLLFGLVGASVFIYSLLSLMNPRIEARLEPAVVALGESATFSWRMHGSASRITQFRIILRGREEVRYRQGTSISMDNSIFAWEVLAETRAVPDMLEGCIAFTIPEYSMHSFEGENNRVRWSIVVHGDIPFWPDVSEDFSITVAPMQRREG